MSEDELIRRHIEQDPWHPGPDGARLILVGVHVWAIVGYLDAFKGDVAAVARNYDVPQEAILAALAYYRQNKCVIDARIAANAA
ncbi:MAG: hypothetical protein ACR2JY_09150 [Chloroflexota bacterium]